MTKISCLPRTMMQNKVTARKDKLIEQYRMLCMNKAADGRELSYNYAAAQRSFTKKDICILTLLEKLLDSVPSDFYIDDDDAIDAFVRLTKEG